MTNNTPNTTLFLMNNAPNTTFFLTNNAAKILIFFRKSSDSMEKSRKKKHTRNTLFYSVLIISTTNLAEVAEKVE